MNIWRYRYHSRLLELLNIEDLISLFNFSVKIMNVPVKMFNEWRKNALIQLIKSSVMRSHQTFKAKSELGNYMLSSRCTFSLPFKFIIGNNLFGRSVLNQRIERLWPRPVCWLHILLIFSFLPVRRMSSVKHRKLNGYYKLYSLHFWK